jgi:hypothetical protein
MEKQGLSTLRGTLSVKKRGGMDEPCGSFVAEGLANRQQEGNVANRQNRGPNDDKHGCESKYGPVLCSSPFVTTENRVALQRQIVPKEGNFARLARAPCDRICCKLTACPCCEDAGGGGGAEIKGQDEHDGQSAEEAVSARPIGIDCIGGPATVPDDQTRRNAAERAERKRVPAPVADMMCVGGIGGGSAWRRG